MASKKKSFPDLNKDGKITKADVLKGRGVYKYGGKVEKEKIDKLVDSPKKENIRQATTSDKIISAAKKVPGMVGTVASGVDYVRRKMKASGGLAVDEVGNPKGKKKSIQIAGWGKARH